MWVGHAGDLRDARAVFAAGVQAVVELADSELMAVLPRDLVRLRFPLSDGGDNPPWLLRLAAESVAALLRAGAPVLVCCSAGMSRSVAVAAAGVAIAERRALANCIIEVVGSGPADMSPGLLAGMRDALEKRVERDGVENSADEAVPGNDLSAVRGGYDRWAEVYDHDANPLQALEGPAVRAAVGAVRGSAALDLGCGTGRHALWLAAQGAAVTAVDFSEGMLAVARGKPGAGGVDFVAHDLHRPLPFADGSFDLVVSGLVLEHLRELDGFFAEAFRVVRPGGRAVVSAMHPAMFLRGTQARFTDPSSGELVQPGSVNHAVGAFAMAALRAGFTLSDVQELAPDDAFAARHARAAKYVGWPMLVVLTMAR